MATAAHVVERFSTLTGHLPSTVDRIVRALRAEGLVPTGGKGGGIRAAHFGVSDINNVILGLAGLQPSDAPQAVTALRPLPYVGVRYKGERATIKDFDNSVCFGEMLDKIVYGFTITPQKPTASIYCDAVAWDMTICLDPLLADLNARDLSGSIHPTVTLEFGERSPDAKLSPRAMKRLTIITADLLFAASELFGDTAQRLDSAVKDHPLPGLLGGSQGASSSPENGKAAEAPTSTASWSSQATTNQPQTASRTKVQSAPVCVFFQPHRLGSSLSGHGSTHEPRKRHDEHAPP